MKVAALLLLSFVLSACGAGLSPAPSQPAPVQTEPQPSQPEPSQPAQPSPAEPSQPAPAQPAPTGPLLPRVTLTLTDAAKRPGHACALSAEQDGIKIKFSLQQPCPDQETVKVWAFYNGVFYGGTGWHGDGSSTYTVPVGESRFYENGVLLLSVHREF